jgi:hypothetical protein
VRAVADKQEPLWLDAVRRFERAIGDPIESVVTSEAYFDAMTRFKRAQSQVTGAVENVTNDMYRMFNIPAGSDVRKLREQLSRMERRLEAMSKELAKRDSEPVHPKSKPSARAKPRSKPTGKPKLADDEIVLADEVEADDQITRSDGIKPADETSPADETKLADEVEPSDGPKQAK